ncbi:MAG: J domain-containing protein [Acetivibrionales bacterium]|jgi:hypothetical protein
MADHSRFDEIKRKLRRLKKLEIRIRFGGAFHAVNYTADVISKSGRIRLVWDDFFSLGDKSNPGAKYRLADIAAMDREEYKNVVDEFFFNVYYRYYTENGITGAHLYDPDTLDWMGLPPDATAEDIKKRFRELAKKYHPDTGGDSRDFIRLMENYQKLLD